jgi:hypothetical protein
MIKATLSVHPENFWLYCLRLDVDILVNVPINLPLIV